MTEYFSSIGISPIKFTEKSNDSIELPNERRTRTLKAFNVMKVLVLGIFRMSV